MLVRCPSVLGNVALKSSAEHGERQGSCTEETQTARSWGEGIKSGRNHKEGNETGSHKGGRRKAGRRRPTEGSDRKEGQHDPATVGWEFELGATLVGSSGCHAAADILHSAYLVLQGVEAAAAANDEELVAAAANDEELVADAEPGDAEQAPPQAAQHAQVAEQTHAEQAIEDLQERQEEQGDFIWRYVHIV